MSGVEKMTSAGTPVTAVENPSLRIVNALPSNPYDGQEICYQNAAMETAGLVWRFRYRATSSSAYKWEFIGGPEWMETNDGTDTLNNATFGDLGTNVIVTIPLAGDYRVRTAMAGAAGAAGHVQYMSYKIGATNAVSSDGVRLQGAGVNYPQASVSRTQRKNALAAATDLKLQYATDASVCTFFHRSLSVAPIRVG